MEAKTKSKVRKVIALLSFSGGAIALPVSIIVGMSFWAFTLLMLAK